MNEEIHQLWHDNPDFRWVVNPAIPHHPIHRIPKYVLPPNHPYRMALLSINPSFPIQIPQPAAAALAANFPDIEPAEVFDWNDNFNLDVATVTAQLHEDARHHYPWFAPINALAQTLVGDEGYHHVDAFLPLAPRAGCLPACYGNHRNFQSLDPVLNATPEHRFVATQLEICYRLLCLSEPKFIIARYAGAADALKTFICSTLQRNQDVLWEALPVNGNKKCLKICHLTTAWSEDVPLLRFSDRQGIHFGNEVLSDVIMQNLEDYLQ